LHTLVSTARWFLLLILLCYLRCLATHFPCTGQRSMDLTCSNQHIIKPCGFMNPLKLTQLAALWIPNFPLQEKEKHSCIREHISPKTSRHKAEPKPATKRLRVAAPPPPPPIKTNKLLAQHTPEYHHRNTDRNTEERKKRT